MKEHISLLELAKLLGISRIAVYQKVKKGQIPATRIGRAYAVNMGHVAAILRKEVSEEDKRRIEGVVKRAIKEYGEVYRLLAKE